jgi:pimeloyl-ACP methyl ester carboxylesterase
VSTPRSLDLPELVRPVTMHTPRGPFAALQSRPASGVCERKPALLIPGFTGSKEDFIPVLQSLARAGRVVTAIDLRGQYQSHDPDGVGSGRFTPDELAADLLAITDALAPDDDGIHLLGHSLGGLIVRHTALASAARIASLTLLSSGPDGIPGARREALLASLAMLGEGSKAVREADQARLRAWTTELWDTQLGPQAEADGLAPEIIAFLKERHLGNDPVAMVVMGQYLLNCPDRTTELAAVPGLPLLVMYGENDNAWPPETQDRMGRRLDAQRVCIPGAAHSPAIEAPETTASTLTTFWNNAEEARRKRRRETALADRNTRG